MIRCSFHFCLVMACRLGWSCPQKWAWKRGGHGSFSQKRIVLPLIDFPCIFFCLIFFFCGISSWLWGLWLRSNVEWVGYLTFHYPKWECLHNRNREKPTRLHCNLGTKIHASHSGAKGAHILVGPQSSATSQVSSAKGGHWLAGRLSNNCICTCARSRVRAWRS